MQEQHSLAGNLVMAEPHIHQQQYPESNVKMLQFPIHIKGEIHRKIISIHETVIDWAIQTSPSNHNITHTQRAHRYTAQSHSNSSWNKRIPGSIESFPIMQEKSGCALITIMYYFSHRVPGRLSRNAHVLAHHLCRSVWEAQFLESSGWAHRQGSLHADSLASTGLIIWSGLFPAAKWSHIWR